jgi:hypothetical protein
MTLKDLMTEQSGGGSRVKERLGAYYTYVGHLLRFESVCLAGVLGKEQFLRGAFCIHMTTAMPSGLQTPNASKQQRNHLLSRCTKHNRL